MGHFLWKDSSWAGDRGKYSHPGCKNGSSTAIRCLKNRRDLNLQKSWGGALDNPDPWYKSVDARKTFWMFFTLFNTLMNPWLMILQQFWKVDLWIACKQECNAQDCRCIDCFYALRRSVLCGALCLTAALQRRPKSHKNMIKRMTQYPPKNCWSYRVLNVIIVTALKAQIRPNRGQICFLQYKPIQFDSEWQQQDANSRFLHPPDPPDLSNLHLSSPCLPLSPWNKLSHVGEHPGWVVFCESVCWGGGWVNGVWTIDCQSVCCADVQPPGSGSEIGDSGRTADVRLLLCTPEQTLIGYLGMHGCYFKAIMLLTGMYIMLHLHVHCLSVGK